METKITALCNNLGIRDDECIPYGFNKAKIDLKIMKRLKNNGNGKLILVTAINPTPAGEGKTTVSIGLAQGLKKVGKRSFIALREPSLGPVFGLKGGATGGGKSIVLPEEEINLHFTGDLHAITSAHNLLSALIDNHIHQGNDLGIDRVVWPRTMDMNDRALRTFETKTRKDGFVITAASEIMAILALANDLNDLNERINRILIGYDRENKPLFVSDLGGSAAMTLLLKDAMNPNMVQSVEGVPAFIHAGPFANIAHGCNSVVATKMALKLGEYVVTEAGFGADLGMEKFLDLKMPHLPKDVDAIVIVATLRALKLHGGASDYEKNDLAALKAGLPHLEKHIRNIKNFGANFVIALNHFKDDDQKEIDHMMDWARQNGYPIALAKGFAEGGDGMTDLAEEVIRQANVPSTITPAYDASDSPRTKIEKIAKTIYGAKEVVFGKHALRQLEDYAELGWNLPVCMAKTPLSLTGDSSIKGLPKDFTLEIKRINPSLGAGFLVALTKGIMVMPGLNKTPRALRFYIDDNGEIHEKDA
jgi:formate--tetrahydrofolate ligase